MDNALRVQELHARCYFTRGCCNDRQIGASQICGLEPASAHSILQLQADVLHSPERLMQVTGIWVSNTWPCMETRCTDTSREHAGGAQATSAQGRHAE